MNLIALRNEVLGKGFDPIQYGSRVTQYLNDAQNLVASRVDYYVDDAVSTFSTIPGTDLYAWPASFARMRSLFDTTRNVEMQYVSVRDIDRSSKTNGAPIYYALTGQSVRLYPVPDNAYPMEMRYWTMPAPLVLDTDTPSIPTQWHHMLWVYATARCFESDDDSAMGQYWDGRFNNELSQFAADVKFPSSDGPSQAAGMWDSDQSLGSGNWSLYGTGW